MIYIQGILKKIRRGIIKNSFINIIERKDFISFYSIYLEWNLKFFSIGFSLH